MKALLFLVLFVSAVGTTAAQQSGGQNPPARDVRSELAAVSQLAGEPHLLSAAGVTRSELPLLTLENPSSFDIDRREQRRLVIVGGLDGDERGTAAALAAVRWFKTLAPRSLRQEWTVSVLPDALPAHATTTSQAPAPRLVFPPEGGFFDHPDQPESRYVWRWVTFQSPDLVLEIRGGDSIAWSASGVSGLSNVPLPLESLAAAISSPSASAPGTAPGVVVTARAIDGPQLLQQLLKAASAIGRSPLHAAIAARVSRQPLDIARVLAKRYPQNPIVSYIPSVSWFNLLRLSDATHDSSFADAVRQQTQPWTSGARPLFSDRIALTAAAGTMIYAELAERGDERARALAIQGADAASAEGADGIAQYGQGWTDDMFMASAILSRTGRMPGRARDLDRVAALLISYAKRLQRQDGVFDHFTPGRQAWGRGNGFAAMGLMEALTALPASHPARAEVLAIYLRQMNGLKQMQAPDGTWRQIIDEPGSYREESATAMTLSAMARGVRLGWLDQSYRPVIARAWRALAAHVTEDGGIVDISTSTGAGPTRRYYFDRAAISGADDRGGAMALMASMEMYLLANNRR
jgi:unsaturated rhamnogalacturonyl hydrolase